MRKIVKFPKIVRIWSHCQEKASLLNFNGADKKDRYSNPVDPGVPKRPIRFKFSVRTGNPLLWVSQNLPSNEATGHPPTVKCKQKNQWGHESMYRR